MNTLREFYIGESGTSRETWGYKKNGVIVRLGSKHYAEELCKKYNVECIKLNDLTDEERKDQERSVGQENANVRETCNTFSAFLMTN